MSSQCKDVSADRALGGYWEREFCKMAAKLGRSFTPHQIGRDRSAITAYRHAGKYHTATLPDVTVWTRPGEHHELKHKDQTSDGKFGLERYRLDALCWFAEETGQSVYYTIHCYDFVELPTRKARKEATENNEAHWLTASVLDLATQPHDVCTTGPRAVSWVNGQRRENIEIWYWRAELFMPLAYLWDLVIRPAGAPLLQSQLC